MSAKDKDCNVEFRSCFLSRTAQSDPWAIHPGHGYRGFPQGHPLQGSQSAACLDPDVHWTRPERCKKHFGLAIFFSTNEGWVFTQEKTWSQIHGSYRKKKHQKSEIHQNSVDLHATAATPSTPWFCTSPVLDMSSTPLAGLKQASCKAVERGFWQTQNRYSCLISKAFCWAELRKTR